MNNKKLSFKELLKELYQHESISFLLGSSLLLFFFSNLTIFLFILLPSILFPKINILDIGDPFLFLLITFGLFLLPIISVKYQIKGAIVQSFLQFQL